MLRKQSGEEQRKRIQIAARRNIFDIELKLYHSNSFGFVGDQFQCFYGHSHEALEVLAVEEGELTFEADGFLRNYTNDNIDMACRYMVQTGRYLISLIEG